MSQAFTVLRLLYTCNNTQYYVIMLGRWLTAPKTFQWEVSVGIFQNGPSKVCSFCPKLCVFDIFKLAMIFARVFCLYKCFPVLLRVLFKAMITEDAELR